MTHYVLLKLAPNADKKVALERVQKTYKDLDQTLDFLHNPIVYTNCIDRDSNMDIMIQIEVEGGESNLQAYLTHPLHMQMAQDLKSSLASKVSFDHN